ncbi:unnamed protein product [Callosobruchus maculatus]|uniref:Uncharacterized protein n=1 Tax=Callosobruchus maculatus TaxID=64391 RepID=A0A653D0E0_CALMS|nr:unnamed protein product [Callosobruchus maculatus]
MSSGVEFSVIRGPEPACMYNDGPKVRVYGVKEAPQDPEHEKKGAFEYMDAGDLVLFWIEIMLLAYIFCFVLSVMIIVIYKNNGEKGYSCRLRCTFCMPPQ